MSLFTAATFGRWACRSWLSRAALGVLTALVLVSCGGGGESAQPVAPTKATELPPRVAQQHRPTAWYMDQGRAVTSEAFRLLSTNLVQAMNAGGVTNALPVCSEKAAPLTAAVALTNQVALRRLTHKARNPDNQATTDEVALIEQFQAVLGAGQTPAPVLVTNRNDTLSLYAPIVINHPVCLQCHGQLGQEIQPSTAALLETLYPRDQATGFKMGDLRGLWRVDFQP